MRKKGCSCAAAEVGYMAERWGRRAVIVDVAAIVVGVAAAVRVEVLIGPRVRRIPALETVLVDILRHPVRLGLLAQVPLALERDVVAGRAHDGGDVGQVERQFDLGIGRRRHVLFEGVLHAVLGREIAREQRGAAGRAHTGIAAGVGELDRVLLQPGHPRQVLLGPVIGEVHDLALLIGDEEDHVHPGEAACLLLVLALLLFGVRLQGRGRRGERGQHRQSGGTAQNFTSLDQEHAPHTSGGDAATTNTLRYVAGRS